MGRKFSATRPAPDRWFLGMLACLTGWSGPLHAAQFDYNLGYRAEYSDNVTRIPSEREAQSELINTAFGNFQYLENTGTINVRVIGTAAYNNYYNNTFDNQTTYSLDAYGELFALQRTLSWVAADGFRRLQIDPLLPDTPTNRQNSNAWATGPNAYLRFGTVDTVTLEGRYGRAWVENQEIDNDRYSYAVRWAHRGSARSTLSLNYEYLDVDYENDVLNADLFRHNYFFRTSVRDARNEFTLDVGRTRIEREGFGPVSDWLVHAIASMQPGGVSVAGLRYRREFSDTGAELLPSGVATQPSTGTGAPSLGADMVSSEPFYMQEAELFYSQRGNLFPWTARLFYRDIEYEISPSDRQEKGALLDLRYLYSGTMSFQLFSGYTIFEYEQPVRQDKAATYGAVLAYRMGPNLQVGLDARRFGRRSSAPDQDYTDDRFTLSIMYGSRPAGR